MKDNIHEYQRSIQQGTVSSPKWTVWAFSESRTHLEVLINIARAIHTYLTCATEHYTDIRHAYATPFSIVNTVAPILNAVAPIAVLCNLVDIL